jgi:predicted ribosome quality control (RQC) complex YloA/Tae2 family protein
MRWDSLLTAALARELDSTLRRMRVRAFVLDGDARRVLIFLREGTLVFELHPEAGWVVWTDPAEPPSGAHSLAARVVEVAPLPDERALRIGMQRVRGRDEGLELHVEWTANRWNALFVGHRSRVIRHLLTTRTERDRTLAVGEVYRPPPSSGREGLEGDLTEDRWRAIVAAGIEAGDPRRELLRTVAGTSSLNIDRFAGEKGHAAWSGALDPSSWGGFVIDTPRGPQPYPIPLPEHPSRPAGSLLEAFQEARSAATASVPVSALLLPPGLLERAEKRLDRLEGRVRGMRAQLDQAVDPEPVRAKGDLLLARYHEIPKGSGEVVLTDFEGNELRLELDPALQPHQNAARYYDEAARLERTRRELPAKLERAETAAAAWRARVEALREGTADPAETLEALGPEVHKGRGGAGAPGTTLPYRTFISSGGLEVRVGRGAARNDDLTFRHSAPDDIWLHARQAPGAHVILRWQSDETPPRRDLVEAAVLAALHSEARHSGSVPVDWTRRKYVRKPRKAAPGAVIPNRVQTLFVEPDPELPGRLQRRAEE